MIIESGIVESSHIIHEHMWPFVVNGLGEDPSGN
jgi:hypothetical protein